MTRHLGYVALVLAAFLSGCVTQQFVPVTDIKNPSADKVTVFVQRKDSFFGGGRTVTVQDNGKPIGAVANNESLAWERGPGQLRLSLEPSFGVVKEGKVLIVPDTKAGNVYRYYVEWSWKAGSFVLTREHSQKAEPEKELAGTAVTKDVVRPTDARPAEEQIRKSARPKARPSDDPFPSPDNPITHGWDWRH